MIDGKTKIFFMMAHPIEHVRSPEVFNPLFKARGINAIMVPFHVLPEDMEICWETLKRVQNLGGIIASVPLKETVFRLCETRDDSASVVRAANVVRRHSDGQMVCANFDGAGFLKGLLDDGRDAIGRQALLVGAGGAGTSIAFALARSGIASLQIADADRARAMDLAHSVRRDYPLLKIDVGEASPEGKTLIVNATPCGLHPETDPLPLAVDRLEPGMLVVDIVMKPRQTPLLAAAEKRGCDIRYGAGMLDSQVDLILGFFGYEAEEAHNDLRL